MVIIWESYGDPMVRVRQDTDNHSECHPRHSFTYGKSPTRYRKWVGNHSKTARKQRNMAYLRVYFSVFGGCVLVCFEDVFEGIFGAFWECFEGVFWGVFGVWKRHFWEGLFGWLKGVKFWQVEYTKVRKMKKNHIFYRKYLVISEKSSIFACFFGARGR